jgi:hypothetical protein
VRTRVHCLDTGRRGANSIDHLDLFGRDIRQPCRSAIAGKYFGEVYGLAWRVLLDLFAATEPVADEQIALASSAYGGKEDAFGERLRDFELISF